MGAIFTESLMYETLFNTVVYRSNKTHIQALRKRCGMAAIAAPKICRERESKKEEKGGKKEKRGERTESGEKGTKARGGEEGQTNGCKTSPWNCQKKITEDTERGKKKTEETKQASENIVTDERFEM